jgi:hypothetical protein
MLSEEEKAELREMAASATLREDFRTLRRNSGAGKTAISADDLIAWLSAMAVICPKPVPRPFVHYIHAKI